ncbi:HD domain-containing protein [Acidithiobacillus sp.]
MKVKKRTSCCQRPVGGISAEPYFAYWGKADPNYPNDPKWHPLIYHCLDVAVAASFPATVTRHL